MQISHMQFGISPTADSKNSKSFLIIQYDLVESIDGLTILMLWTSSLLPSVLVIINFFIQSLAAIQCASFSTSPKFIHKFFILTLAAV